MRYLVLLFLALNFQLGFGQVTKDGMQYFPPQPLEFDGVKIYFGRTYGTKRKTVTELILENNNPDKVLFFRIDTIQFNYPNNSFVSRDMGSRKFKTVPNGRSIKKILGHSNKKINHFFERFSLNYQGVRIANKLKWETPLEPFPVKNYTDTILEHQGIQITFRKSTVNKRTVNWYMYFQVNAKNAKHTHYVYNREKVIFRNSAGEVISGPDFRYRHITIDSTRKERLIINHKFKTEDIFLDLSEAISPIEIQEIQLPEFHFFAKAPFGHEVICQDKIELKDGTIIFGTVARLTDELVAYKKCIDGPISESYDFTEVPRSDLKRITYSNGEIDDFENNNENISEKYIKTMIEIHKLAQ